MADTAPVVAILMGSQSDWSTMKHAAAMLDRFAVAFEARVLSAHRNAQRFHDYMTGAKARGLKVIIGGAGGAAHLPGVAASLTTLPVLGVPIETASLGGIDSLYSIVQMPGGVPVGTLAIGKPGAVNAALLAVAVLALADPGLAAKLERFREEQAAQLPEIPQD